MGITLLDWLSNDLQRLNNRCTNARIHASMHPGRTADSKCGVNGLAPSSREITQPGFSCVCPQHTGNVTTQHEARGPWFWVLFRNLATIVSPPFALGTIFVQGTTPTGQVLHILYVPPIPALRSPCMLLACETIHTHLHNRGSQAHGWCTL